MDESLTPDQIAENAAGADQFEVDGQTAKQVPIPDQIMAAKFAAANKPSVRRRRGGVRVVRYGLDAPQ
ncbi:MAG TPA: hypothetical protein VD866_31240 [Urbifossiella sp.]|nr:hypothetical protein [Urbifossiella sp.]